MDKIRARVMRGEVKVGGFIKVEKVSFKQN